MQVPYEFEQLVKSFYPSSRDEYSTIDEWIAGTLAHCVEREKTVIKQFLDELLSGRHSDEEIETVWRMQYPSWDFTAGGHRVFLNEIRKRLG